MGDRNVMGLSLLLLALLILRFMATSDTGAGNADPRYRKLTFDVFINHRGPDVKNTLASHIYHHLHGRGYTPFLDKYSIKIGEYSWEAIYNAMDTASVFVTIISPRYAESEFCMDELKYMVEKGKPIIPIFYKISPSELLMEQADGLYARAFQEHAKEFEPHTLEKWRDAFRKVSDIAGYVFNDSEDEGALVWRIGTRVSEYIGKPTRPACDSSGMIVVHVTIPCGPHEDNDANCFNLSIIDTGTLAVRIRNPSLSLDILHI